MPLSATSPPLALAGLHAPLEDVLLSIKDKAAPSLDDRLHLLHSAFKHFESITAGCRDKGCVHAIKKSEMAIELRGSQ